MRLAIDGEGNADPVEQEVGFAPHLGYPPDRRFRQPIGDLVEVRSHLALGGAHFIVLLGAFQAKFLSGKSKTHARGGQSAPDSSCGSVVGFAVARRYSEGGMPTCY